MSDEAIHKAIDAARTFLQDDAERLAYINRELAILDYNSDHRDAFEEGEAKGRAGECKIVCVKRNCTNLLYAPYWGNQS